MKICAEREKKMVKIPEVPKTPTTTATSNNRLKINDLHPQPPATTHNRPQPVGVLVVGGCGKVAGKLRESCGHFNSLIN